MTHRFPIKEIALQAGMSTATVDRALHDRPNVSPQTRARIAAAIAELEGQERQLSARGRRLFFDFVVEAPRRFSTQIRAAVEQELPLLQPAVVRPRFTFREEASAQVIVRELGRIQKRGSQGICLKARDLPQIRHALEQVASKGIPVVCLFTDVAAPRLAYVGIDNATAGRTAAYLIARAARGAGCVLATRSSAQSAGEAERAEAFRAALRARRRDLDILDVAGGDGLPLPTAEQVRAALSRAGQVRGVYSMGGGNPAILAALAAADQAPDIFVAHDLDADNRALLRREAISYVLQDDLRADVRAACQWLLQHHGVIRLDAPPAGSDVLILTPANLP